MGGGAATFAPGTAMPAEYTKTTLWQNRKCLLFAVFMALGPFQYGFDNGIVAAFQAQPGFLREFGTRQPNGRLGIDATFQQLLASLPYVGQAVFSLAFGTLSVYIGRLNFTRLSMLLCVVAILLQIFAKGPAEIYVGRLLLGGHNLANDFVALAYNGEIAPAHLRGIMAGMYQTFTGFGALLGSIVSNEYSTATGKSSYQIQLALILIVPTILFCATFFMPESPRWLAVKERHDQSKNSLIRLRGTGPQAEFIELEFESIKKSIEHEKELSSGVRWIDLFRGPDLRRTLLSLACISLQTCTGNPLLTSYSTYFYRISGLVEPNPFQATIISKGVCGTLGGILGLFATRYFGRRTLLLTSYSVGSLCMLIVAIVYTIQPTALSTGRTILGVFCVFNLFFFGAMAPASWVLGTEIPNNRLRSKTLALGFAVSRISQWLVAFTSPYYINPTEMNWGAKYGYLWAGTGAIAVIFIYFFLPEVRNRTLEEVTEMFENGVPARKFATYKCVSAQHSRTQTEDRTDSIASEKGDEDRTEKLA